MPGRLKLDVVSRKARAKGFTGECTREAIADNKCDDALHVVYDASETIDRTGKEPTALVVNTNAGERQGTAADPPKFEDGRPNTHVDLPKVPDYMELCVATDGFCRQQGAFVVETASLKIDASETMEVNMFDCKEAGEDDRCNPDQRGLEEDADEQVHSTLDLEAVRFLELEINPPPALGQVQGHVFVNTTHEVGKDGRTVEEPGTGTRVMEPVIGDGLPDIPDDGVPGSDFFSASRSTDSCSEGKIKRIIAKIGRLEAVDRIVNFDIETPTNCALVVTATGVNVKDAAGFFGCDDSRIDMAAGFFLLGNITAELCGGSRPEGVAVRP